ncbi:DUF4906 domain-containing protein [Xylanibacter oryzae]|uniref:DUF4906 domain-containing protein n=1 Tax=Xylanibacter oryzae TaxID=185293 RepID=UPI0004BCC2EF|nr:DUF4906 domain-containing protein [Xylanibacter oryzae]
MKKFILRELQNIKKHIIRHCSYLLFLMACMSLPSCSSVDIPEISSDHVSLTVNISRQSPTIVTRAISDAIDNIDILVFDGQGNLIGSAYTSTSPTSVTLPVRVSAGCTICAVANTGSSSYLDGISTLAKLRAKVTAPVSDPASTLGIMYGETPNVTITNSTAAQSVLLKRIYSKYTFTITPSKEITITDYQLCNVPNECFIAPDSSSNPTTGYSGINYSPVTTLVSSGGVVTAGPYYVLENLAGNNNSLTASEQRTSANAPSCASYILINAKRDAGWGTGWKSTYRIYLGGVTNDISPVLDCTDFNIYRNYNYNCNVSISGSGINDIRVTYSPYTTRTDIYTGDAIIGNYLYSDGTSGTTFKSGQTVGIIYSNELNFEQYNVDGCRHGKVLALKNANGGACCNWSGEFQTSNPPVFCTTMKATYEDIASGYVGTLDKGMADSQSNNAWYYCHTYNDGITKSFTNTGWYLPSGGDWWDVMENLGTWTADQYTTIKGMRTSTIGINNDIILNLPASTYFDNLNTKLLNAGGDKISLNTGAFSFYTASEHDTNGALRFMFNSARIYLGYNNKNLTINYARAVLAY